MDGDHDRGVVAVGDIAVSLRIIISRDSLLNVD
jgi:hypothetical protein